MDCCLGRVIFLTSPKSMKNTENSHRNTELTRPTRCLQRCRQGTQDIYNKCTLFILNNPLPYKIRSNQTEGSACLQLKKQAHSYALDRTHNLSALLSRSLPTKASAAFYNCLPEDLTRLLKWNLKIWMTDPPERF